VRVDVTVIMLHEDFQVSIQTGLGLKENVFLIQLFQLRGNRRFKVELEGQ
jgi:hypothetical protein